MKITLLHWICKGVTVSSICFRRHGNQGSEIQSDSANRWQNRLSSQPHSLPWTTGRCRGFFSLPPLGTVLGLYLSWSFKGQLCSIRAPQAFLQETPFTHVSRTSLTWCWENNKRPHLDYDSGGGTLAKTQHIPEINPEEAWGNTQIKEFPRITTSC